MKTILRSNPKSYVPSCDGTMTPHFVVGDVEDVELQVVNPDNGSITKIKQKRPFTRVISDDVLEHVGEPCEMYSLENLQAANVPLQTLSNFYRPSIESASALMDNVESVDVSELTNVPSKNNE